MNITMGSGRLTYEVQAGWSKLPKGWSFLEVVDVAVDAQDRVYVFTRGEHPLLIFDREGNLLASWGEGLFKRPHGITMGPKETLYLIDDGGHAVYQFTLDGKLLMTLGTPGKGAGFISGQPFQQPTKVARDPKTGELYISDGYGNARVHKYTSDGKYLFSWGECGTDPGQFNLVHSVVLDRAGRVFVADRENDRIQVFSPTGQFLNQWTHVQRPTGLCMRDGLIYVSELWWVPSQRSFRLGKIEKDMPGRASVLDMSGKVLAQFGHEGEKTAPGSFIAPHGICADSRGDLYVAEVTDTFASSRGLVPVGSHTFQKFARL
jgi:streptogramin lyase